MKRAILVDEKCVELARHFLSEFALSDEHDIEELAERFQATAESFCELAFNVPEAPELSPLDMPKEGWKP